MILIHYQPTTIILTFEYIISLSAVEQPMEHEKH